MNGTCPPLHRGVVPCENAGRQTLGSNSKQANRPVVVHGRAMTAPYLQAEIDCGGWLDNEHILYRTLRGDLPASFSCGEPCVVTANDANATLRSGI